MPVSAANLAYDRVMNFIWALAPYAPAAQLRALANAWDKANGL